MYSCKLFGSYSHNLKHTKDLQFFAFVYILKRLPTCTQIFQKKDKSGLKKADQKLVLSICPLPLETTLVFTVATLSQTLQNC